MDIKCKYDEWEGYEVVSFNVNHIFDCSPSDEDSHFSNNLYQSIIKGGLTNPLILVPTSPKDLERILSNTSHNLTIPFEKSIIFALFGGSSRLSVLRDMGVEFVDCILLPYNGFSHVQKLQRLQRRSHKELYGRIN